MRKKIALILLITLTATLSASNTVIKVSTGKKSGHTSYAIGAQSEIDDIQELIHFPISKLRFPLKLHIITLDAEKQLTPHTSLRASVETNFDTDPGTFKDYDWITESNPKQLDIYSESDVEAYTYQFELELKRQFKNNIDSAFGLRYQQYSFEAFDTIQSYPSDPNEEPLVSPGKSITYDVQSIIPYWEFSKRIELYKNKLSIAYAHAPYLFIKDEDDHIKRSKLATGELTGAMHQVRIEYKRQINNFSQLFINVHYHLIKAVGTQTQTRYAATIQDPVGLIGSIKEQITNEESSIALGVQINI